MSLDKYRGGGGKRVHVASFKFFHTGLTDLFFFLLFTCVVLAVFKDSTYFHSSPYLKRVQGIKFIFAIDHSSSLKRQIGQQ